MLPSTRKLGLYLDDLIDKDPRHVLAFWVLFECLIAFIGPEGLAANPEWEEFSSLQITGGAALLADLLVVLQDVSEPEVVHGLLLALEQFSYLFESILCECLEHARRSPESSQPRIATSNPRC